MSWQIDPSHSSIEFTVKHMMFTTVRGRLGSFAGEISIDDANPAASSATGSVDVSSIDTRDDARDDNLKSAEFFDVDHYPKMTFRSTRVQPTGKNKYRVTGDLAIKEVTRQITWYVSDQGKGKDPSGNLLRTLSATTSISRKDFGITWNVALESGGLLVGDKVNVSAEIQLGQVQ